MGFVSIINFAAGSFHVFAWPIITLVYPLYASVQAIESNSLANTRKWLTYWVLCGLIMLFELTSARLIEWLPFWPYIRLMVTIWLVVPHFDGAVYAYDHFVRPCFSVNPEVFGYWLRPKQDQFRVDNQDDFVLHAKRFVQENGSEALEKLISSKIKCAEPKLPIAESNSVVSVNNEEADAKKGIKLTEPGLDQTVQNVDTDNKATTEAKVVDVASELSQSSLRSIVQKEWICPLCQVCTQSEVVLQNHFQGKKHKAKEKELLEKHMAAKNKTASASKSYNASASASNLHNRGKPKATLKEGPSAYAQTNNDKPTAGSKVASGGRERFGGSITPDESREWICSLCQICAPNKSALEDHFRGKKHQAKKEELLAKQMEAKCKTANTNKPKATPKECLSSSESSNVKYVNKKEENRAGAIGAGDQRLLVSNENNAKSKNKLYCEQCKLQCNSVYMLTEHLGGKRHFSQLHGTGN